jgi:hypothetical protein
MDFFVGNFNFMFYTIGVIHGSDQDETGRSGQVCTQIGKQATRYKVALKALNRFIAELTTSA